MSLIIRHRRYTMPKKKKPAVDSQQEAAQIDEIYNALPGNNTEPVKKKKSILKILLIIFLIPVILRILPLL